MNHSFIERSEIESFLKHLVSSYKVNRLAGTYICSKMKHYINCYRQSVKGQIYDELKANQIVSSKINHIINDALKESEYEKSFEHFSDAYVSTSLYDNEVQTPVINKVPFVKLENVSLNGHHDFDDKKDLLSPSELETSSASRTECPAFKIKRVMITYKGKSHPLELMTDFNSVSFLKTILCNELKLQKDELRKCVVKYYNPTFSKWVNLRHSSVLKENYNVKIFSPEDLQDKTIDLEDPPGVVNERSSEISKDECIKNLIEDYQKNKKIKSWVSRFSLSNITAPMIKKINSGKVDADTRMAICKRIFQTVKKYDSSPSSKDLEIIQKILFLTYPKLTDMDKDYWVTWNIWKASLENVFNIEAPQQNGVDSFQPITGNKKRKNVSEDIGEPMKIGYGIGKPLENGFTMPLKKRKKSKDSDSNEKNFPKTTSAGDSLMDDTYSVRRMQIVSEGWSIGDIFISYPALYRENEIFAEFSRINRCKAIDKQMESGFRKLFPPLFSLLKTSQKFAHGRQEILDKEKELKTMEPGKTNYKNFEYKMLLFALPFALGENIEDIFKPVESVYHEAVQIEYAGESYDNANKYALVIENEKIECESLKSAVACFVASFFVFNLAYPSDIKKFLYYVERIILELPGKVLPPSQVTALASKIEEILAVRQANRLSNVSRLSNASRLSNEN